MPAEQQTKYITVEIDMDNKTFKRVDLVQLIKDKFPEYVETVNIPEEKNNG